MQIVIDIPEDVYNRFTHNEVKPRYEITEKERFQMNADAIRLTRAFCNGTPLPKGHGDLIDRNELNKDLITNEWITDYDGGGLEEILFNAPTIIAADKEENNADCD